MSSKRPNVLFIMADQMAAPLLPFYDDKSVVKMPHLSRLAQEGVVFESAYCPSPLCAPSRFSLVSGQLPSKIGAYDNAADFAADVPTYAALLAQSGIPYRAIGQDAFLRTGSAAWLRGAHDQRHLPRRLRLGRELGCAGKYVPAGTTTCRPCCRPAPACEPISWTMTKKPSFAPDNICMTMCATHTEQPFCLTVSMTHPHDPYTLPAEFYDLYRDEEIPMPAHVIDQADQDVHSKRLLKVIDLWDKPMTQEAIRRARRSYFGSCSYVDSKVGELLKTLKECDLADDTIIVFSGDHGDMLGERGLWYKMHWFEMAARVPMVIHAPKRFKAARVAGSVSTIDLLPTLRGNGR